MPHYKEGFHLPADYYKPVPTWASFVVLPLLWILIPIWSYNPDLMDPFLDESSQRIVDGQKHNIIRLFTIVLWAQAIQCIVAARQCRKLGISSSTTLRWMVAVGFYGFVSLRHLIWPDSSLARVKVH